MNSYNRVFASTACVALVLFVSSILIKTVIPCSPNPYKPQRDITELAILAPIVIVANVVNISVDSNTQMFTQYSACLDVKEVIKSEDSVSVPKTFCTKEFGTEAMCLVHVFPNTSYVFYLDTDLRARYDAHFSAVRLATDAVIALARRGYCNVENSTNCVSPNMTDVPKKLIEVEEGESLVLTCRASGTKPYVVTWFYKGDSSSLPFNSFIRYDGSLSLRKLTSSAAGRYTCIVKNAAGSASHETRIVIKSKPCGGEEIVDKRFDITSPNFPGKYPPDKSCVWRLCPAQSYRIQFRFNMFHLHRSDAIRIHNDCVNSRSPWRTYCGAVSPGVLVSRCRSKCVELRLSSDIKFHFTEPFFGMNVTVEPTHEKRTKKFDVFKHYCDSDLVIKGRFVVRNPWPFNSIKVLALDTFKQPFGKNSSYDITYKNEDTYGCFYQYEFKKDYFYFATANDDVFNVNAAAADDSREASYVNKMLRRYKNKQPFCNPHPPE